MTPIQEPAIQKPSGPELIRQIGACIQDSDGWIGFDRYMQMALYAPGLGYYSAGREQFGAAGDFITAPEMGGLFGASIAAQSAEILNNIGGGSILEFGAGRGALAATMLIEFDKLGVMPEEYLILELSGALRAEQQETIRARAGSLFSRVRWLDALPSSLSGVVIANEVLDAMPVKLFEQDRAGRISELGVAIDESSEAEFYLQRQTAPPELHAAVTALNIAVEGEAYRSEISLQAPAWIESLGDVVEQGVVLLIDYGFRQAEYYHPDRAKGTLMCHYRHRAHADPFYKPGEQDITAHVDFSAIAGAAQRSNFEVAGYASQGAYLLSSGVLDNIPLDLPVKEQLELAQEVKKLTLPHEMGELFKVLALTKNYSSLIGGFTHQNHRDRL